MQYKAEHNPARSLPTNFNLISPHLINTIKTSLSIPPFTPKKRDKMAAAALTKFKLIFHVPPTSLEPVKSAVFAAGAGRYPGPGSYTECCWVASGTGQFRPGDAANPAIGSAGALEKIEELRVETLCVGEDVARRAVEALKK